MNTIQCIFEEKKQVGALQKAGQVFLGLLLLSLLSPLSVPLPFSPVPLAMQSVGILLCGALMTPRLAATTIALFLAQGLMGLPVFSVGATFGLARFLGPTGGYLIGYFVAAVSVAAMLKKGWSLYLSLAIGTLCIWLMGAVHLATFIGFKWALLKGVLPFVAGDIMKLLFVGKIAPLLRGKLSR